MRTNLNIPEIDEIEKRKERYLKRVKKMFPTLNELEIAALTGLMEEYADEKIDQMFEEENNRNKGKIKVRTENGIKLACPKSAGDIYSKR